MKKGLSWLALSLLLGLMGPLHAHTIHEPTAIKNLTMRTYPRPFPATTTTMWSKSRAHQWATQQGWSVGCNFIPSTAINQLEMWQADTFAPITIDRELGWAQRLGFNTVRVFLHPLAWQQDPAGHKARMETFLTLGEKHHLKTMFVFFDDCWNPNPKVGKQPDPRPGIHNSGWVQSPGKKEVTDPQYLPVLETYVKDILTQFKNDRRILMWDLYNEPGNSEHFAESLPLLQKTFQWARTVNPSQPLTAGVWNWDEKYAALNQFQLNNSDIITFHNYDDRDHIQQVINTLKAYGRPVICTEYMARTRNCTFQTHLPLLKAAGVGALNWGLVAGKTQTIFPWNSPEGAKEPQVWFHDILRGDGSAFDPKEISLIKALTHP